MVLWLFFVLVSWPMAKNIEFRFNSPPFSQGLDLPLLQAINEAHKNSCRIQASFYELTYRPLVLALSNARQKGCNVSVLLEQDNIKTIKDSSGKRDYAPFEALEILMGAGVEVVTDRFLGKGSGKSHNKLVTVSPDFVFSGSVNATSHGLLKSQNHVLMIRDESVFKMVDQELEHLISGGIKGRDKTQKAPEVMPLGTTEVSFCLAPNPVCFFRIKKALYEAEQEILIAMFSLTHPEILKILLMKHRKGLRVEILLDDMAAGAKVSDNGLKIPLREWLKKHQFQFRTDNQSGLMHHKLALIDREVVITGSANWSKSAFQKNDENIWILKSSEVAREFLDAGARELFVAAPNPLPKPEEKRPNDFRILALSVSGSEARLLYQSDNPDLRPKIVLHNQREIFPVSCQDFSDESLCRFNKVPSEYLILLEDEESGFLDLYARTSEDSPLFQLAREMMKPLAIRPYPSPDSCQEQILPGLWQKCSQEILIRIIN